jgi:hypothetical protein
MARARNPVNPLQIRPDLQATRRHEARRLRRQQCARQIWRLGDRVLFELVDHIATRFGIEDEVDHLIERYAALDPVILRALGADRLPPPPIRAVAGRE